MTQIQGPSFENPSFELRDNLFVWRSELIEKDGYKGFEIDGVFAPLREFVMRVTVPEESKPEYFSSLLVEGFRRFEAYILKEIPKDVCLGMVEPCAVYTYVNTWVVTFSIAATIHGEEAKSMLDRVLSNRDAIEDWINGEDPTGKVSLIEKECFVSSTHKECPSVGEPDIRSIGRTRNFPILGGK